MKALALSDEVLTGEVDTALPDEPRGVPVLTLLGGFELSMGSAVIELPVSAQRLLAIVALNERPQSRNALAGRLWPDKDESRSAANLRSALWRLRQPGIPLVRAVGDRIGLDPGVQVDVERLNDLVWKVSDDSLPHGPIPVELTGGELLPEWYEDWVLLEQERTRQARLHALERLCRALTLANRTAEAIEAGLYAVRCDPLRESAHRSLIEAHLAEGNRSEATRQLRMLTDLLDRELGIEPPPDLVDLCRTGLPPAPQTPHASAAPPSTQPTTPTPDRTVRALTKGSTL